MEAIKKLLENLEWTNISEQLHAQGFALVPNVLTAENCAGLINGYDHENLYRKTVQMERYRFGSGEYKYFSYPLPGLLQEIRENLYPWLVPVANQWMNMLRIEKQFPATLKDLQKLCQSHQQVQPTVLILKYGKGGHNTLHQDIYGEIYFPIQAVLFLSEPERDYTGGEFVLMQQTPRAQSKISVLQPRKGDMLLFTTQFRPVKGSKGYYRATVKHGVSELHSGTRFTAGIIFHDATM